MIPSQSIDAARNRPAFTLTCLVCGCALFLAQHRPATAQIHEAGRAIPVAATADVLVVGGTTGAVAAATAAAEAGAKVYLIAPKPYLGEDMAGTLRLWIEPDETPTTELARKLLESSREEDSGLEPDEKPIPITYAADRKSNPTHQDTQPPKKLTDGHWSSAAQHSVQYDGPVKITAKLPYPERLTRLRLLIYHHKDYLFEKVELEHSLDGKTWVSAPAFVNEEPPQGSDYIPAMEVSVPINARAANLRITITPAARMPRVLLGEIQAIGHRSGPDMAARERTMLTPLKIKTTLDNALLNADIPFLHSCCATGILADPNGKIAGIVMANRAGRQAILANVVIDATEWATVARCAGVERTPFKAGTAQFQRVVIGGRPRPSPGTRVRRVDPPFTHGSGSYGVFAYTLDINVPDDSIPTLMHVEQIARDRTYQEEQEMAADSLFWVPPNAVVSRTPQRGPWPGSSTAPLGAFQPAGWEGLYVLGAMSDVDRQAAAAMMRPFALMEIGERIGRHAADLAARKPPAGSPRVVCTPPQSPAQGAVREFLGGYRPGTPRETVNAPADQLPILGTYEVIVAGGGTAGAPAAIAAARHGAKTVVLEMLHGLGGTGTLGAISKYYWGNRVGFTKQVPGGASWDVEERMEWWRRQLRNAKADIWFGTIACGTLVHDKRVKGVVVATPMGRGVLIGNTVIDATGNADLAAASGAPCLYTTGEHIAVQGTGLPPRELGRNYTNTDYTLVDETDMLDVTRVLIQARRKAGRAFDAGQLIDTRERRRIVGRETITILDQVLGRTYSDTVTEAWSNYDTHGYTVAPYLMLAHPPKKQGIRTYLPLRAMLPSGLKGILVVGLGISAERDAIPLIRMQPDIQNGGYAAGIAAAMAANGRDVGDIDVDALQEHLKQVGILRPEVLEHRDKLVISDRDISEAVDSIRDDFTGVAPLLAAPDRAIPALRRAFEQAPSENDRRIYAQLLAVMGEPDGVSDLVRFVEKAETWDTGWNYRAMGQFGRNMSLLDRVIVAIGMAGDRCAVPALLDKVRLLSAESDFSHHRAVALALERLADPRAAEPLARLLQKPGMQGHYLQAIQGLLRKHAERPGNWTDLVSRRNSLRELILARALVRCGDYNGIGKETLRQYADDIRGHWARHAQAVLSKR